MLDHISSTSVVVLQLYDLSFIFHSFICNSIHDIDYSVIFYFLVYHVVIVHTAYMHEHFPFSYTLVRLLLTTLNLRVQILDILCSYSGVR